MVIRGDSLDTPSWGTKDWFELLCDPNNPFGYIYHHKERGLQRRRFELYIQVLKPLVLNSRKKMNILDIGCALGDLTQKIYEINTQNFIWAIDISKNAINIASEKVKGVKFLVGALPSLDFKRGYFDIVCCFEVLYYLDQKSRILGLNNINSVLRNNGHLIIAGPLDGGKQYFDKQILITNLISCGFTVEKIHLINNRIYLYGETKIIRLIERLNFLGNIIRMSNKEYFIWIHGREQHKQLWLINRIKQLCLKYCIFKVFILFLTKLIIRILKKLISITIAPALLERITGKIMAASSATSIILVAKKV